MLCVMMIIVYLFFSLRMSFLIFFVEIGFSVDVGLFISKILGFVVSVLVI